MSLLGADSSAAEPLLVESDVVESDVVESDVDDDDERERSDITINNLVKVRLSRSERSKSVYTHCFPGTG
jgi:hypothetical protein